MSRVDVIVLGAGIVGVSSALHLAKAGASVVLVDRKAPGEETSYGNAGIIEDSITRPTAFPRDVATVLKAAFKQLPAANYHFGALLRLAPWMYEYWRQSRDDRNEASGRALRPLMERAASAHRELIAAAGVEALWREGGYAALYRDAASFAETQRMRELSDMAGIPYEVLDTEGMLAHEPHLAPVFRKAIRWSGTTTVASPGDVTKAYARLAQSLGVDVRLGDAMTLARGADGFTVQSENGAVTAGQVVVALGPWSVDLTRKFGLDLPLAVKRGYHRHFKVKGNGGLSRPVLDVDRYYMLAPMNQGHRLTTGAEFTDRDAPPTPVQLDWVLPSARELVPDLGEPVEATPWMGRRPAFADSLPVIGPAPGVPGMLLAFGHTHWGFTLGPITGQIIAALATGAAPPGVPAAYSAKRFG
jgi:D-amino-acid dehydrogenase